MDNHLADKRHVTFILRLAIEKDGQLVYGEIVDLGGEVIGRFMEWPKIAKVMQTWIKNQSNENTDNQPDNHATNQTS